MKNPTSTTLLLYGCLFFSTLLFQLPEMEAQRRGGRRTLPNQELTILKDVPCWFVNDNSLSKAEKKRYKADATRLALRLINKKQQVAEQTVRVPDELVQQLYTVLVAVRTSEHTVLDTIVKRYKIHTFPTPELKQLVLVVPLSAVWLQPLLEGEDTTGHVAINALIKEYQLVKTRLTYLDEEHTGLVLQALEPLNMAALSLAFFKQAGVGSMTPTTLWGDGNDIALTRLKEGWEIVYQVRFGNCSEQCQKIHEWTFRVIEGGEVTYLGESGSTIPPWIMPARQAPRYPHTLQRR